MVDSILVKGYELGVVELNVAQRVVFFITELDTIVAMERLVAYYDCPAGEYAEDVVAALKRIGATKSAALVHDANSLFSNSTAPRDQNAKRDAVGLLSEVTIKMIGEELMVCANTFGGKFECLYYSIAIGWPSDTVVLSCAPGSL